MKKTFIEKKGEVERTPPFCGPCFEEYKRLPSEKQTKEAREACEMHLRKNEDGEKEWRCRKRSHAPEDVVGQYPAPPMLGGMRIHDVDGPAVDASNEVQPQ